jgi:hypothetical protein
MRKLMNFRPWPELPARGLLLGATLVLTSCGGGGGDGGGSTSPPPPTLSVTGNGFAPGTGPGDTGSYFPVAAGDKWLFDYTTDDPSAPAPSGTVTVSVNGSKTIQGANATVYTRNDSANPAGSYDQYFAVGNGGVTALGNTDTADTISPLIIPYVQLLFPVVLGQVSNVVGQNLAYGTDKNNNPITLDLTQTITNAAMETVDVPAGKFANALRQTTSVDATVKDGTQSAPITASDTGWYVAGVGQIKDQSSATGGGKTLNSSSALRSYVINGQSHGIGPSADLDSTLVTAGCQGSSHPVPAVTSDGTNFLIVAFACSTSSGSALSNWVGVLVAPDGTVLKTVNITAPAAISATQPYVHAVSAFDGTRYLVVYEDVSPSFTTLPLKSVVLGTDGAVIAGPTMVATEAVPADGLPTDREALGFDGNRFLLLYIEGGGPPLTPGMSGLFITPGTGQPAGGAFSVSQSEIGTNSPALAFDGKNYLVIWVRNDTSPVGLHATRVSPAGTLLDPAPFALVDLSHAMLNEGCCDLEPTLAFDGTNYLVAYRDPRNVPGISGLGYASISAARVSTAGVLLDGTATSAGIVVTASNNVPRGRVRSTFMGGVYWLVWGTNAIGQLNATRVTSAGVVSSAWGDGFTIVPAVPYTELPEMAASSAGSLLVWQQRDPNGSQTQLMGLRIYPVGP